MRQLAEVHVYEVGCPRCGAAPLEGCIARTGRSMDYPHRERNQAIRDRESRESKKRHPSVPRAASTG